VSANIAHLFELHAQDYQGLAGRAEAFHQQFVQNLTAGAGAYGSTEAASAAALQPANAIASSVALPAATGNPVFDAFIFGLGQIILFIQNPFLFILSPIINAVINIVIRIIITIIVTAISQGITSGM
jgi:hypothetical protein